MEWAKVLMLLDFESGDLPAQVVDAKGHVPSSTIGTLAFDSSVVKYGNRSLKVNPAGALRYTSADLATPTTQDWTISFWFYATSYPNDAWMFADGACGIGIRNSVICVYRPEVGYVHCPTVVSPLKWHHVAVTHVGAGNKNYVFLDGVLQLSFISAFPILANLYVGSDGQARFAGYLDDFFYIQEALYLTSFIPGRAPRTAIHGVVKKNGVPVRRTVRAFDRVYGVQFGTAFSAADGSYSINSPDGMAYAIAFDDPAYKVEPVNADKIKALLHMAPYGNLTSTKDEAGNSVTLNGAAKIKTGFGKYAGSCLDVTSNGYAYIPASASFDFGTPPYTIELWLYWTGIGSSNLGRVFMAGGNGASASLDLCLLDNGAILVARAQNLAAIQAVISPAGTVKMNEWTHIAFVAVSYTESRMFVNGKCVVVSGTFLYPDSAPLGIAIGMDPSGYAFHGYVDEFCLTLEAKYLSDFVPGPINRNGVILYEPDPVFSSTKLVMNDFDGTFTPQIGVVPSVVSGVTVETHASPFDGPAMVFPAGGYVRFPSHADLGMPTGYTVEFWLQLTALPTSDVVAWSYVDARDYYSAEGPNGTSISGATKAELVSKWEVSFASLYGFAFNAYYDGDTLYYTWFGSQSSRPINRQQNSPFSGYFLSVDSSGNLYVGWSSSAARVLLGSVGVGSVDHVRIQLEYPNLVAYLNGVRITSPFPVSAAVGSTMNPSHQFGDASSGFAGKISHLRTTNKLRYAGPKFKIPSGPPAVEGPTNALIDDYILAEVVQ